MVKLVKNKYWILKCKIHKYCIKILVQYFGLGPHIITEELSFNSRRNGLKF